MSTPSPSTSSASLGSSSSAGPSSAGPSPAPRRRHLAPVDGPVARSGSTGSGSTGSGTGAQLPLPLVYEVAPGVPAVPPLPAGMPPDGVTDGGLPDPRVWAARLARAVAEVAIGERPPAQLVRWVTRDQLTRLALRGQAVQRHPAARAQRGVVRLRTVRAVRACPVAPGVVETSAVIVGGERAHAIAMRLEAVDGRWLATVVQLG